VAFVVGGVEGVAASGAGEGWAGEDGDGGDSGGGGFDDAGWFLGGGAGSLCASVAAEAGRGWGTGNGFQWVVFGRLGVGGEDAAFEVEVAPAAGDEGV
jgi:hypothetical protein